MHRYGLLLALALAACDGTDLEAGDAFLYATDGTDAATDVVQLSNGDLVVVGSSEGVPRPADGTLALPTVLRFDLEGGLQSAEVYRDLGFGSASGVTVLSSGLVVTVASGYDSPEGSSLRVFRASDSGRRGDVVLDLEGGYSPPKSVLAMSDGGFVVAVSGANAADPQLYRFDASGARVWASRVEGASGLTAVSAGPAGSVYALGWGSEGGVVARIGPSGDALWRVVGASRWNPTSVAQTPNGVAVLEGRNQFEEGSAVRVVRYAASDGAEIGAVEVAQAPGANGDDDASAVRVQPGPMAAFPDGRVVVGWVEATGGFDTPPTARLAVVGDAVGTIYRFGQAGRWPSLNALAVLEDGRVAAAGGIGPERISGYGGDNFDVLVSLYDAE